MSSTRQAYRNPSWVRSVNWPDVLAITAIAAFWVILLGGIIYAAAAGIYAAGRPSHRVWFSTYDYIKADGLDVQKSYHLRLGSPTGGGSYGHTQTTTSTDFFLIAGNVTTTTSSSVAPSSVVRLSFQRGNTSSILEIPYTKVRFHPNAGAKDRVKFAIWNNPKFDYVLHANVGANFWAFDRGHVSTLPVNLRSTYEWYYVVQNDGLSTFLNKHLAWVDLYLTPQQYSAYLGTLQTSRPKG